MIYSFNQCTLDTDRFLLSLNDTPVATEPLVFNLLLYLIEHRERVVTRDELLEKLWTGKVVTDAALAVRLKDARKAIQDSGAKQSMIKTLHGRGYQFIADVTESRSSFFSKPPPSNSSINIGISEQSPVRYCRSSDGVNIAHASAGTGYPLVSVGSWMTHLERDWSNPMWGHYVKHLSNDYELIRYDQRGNGMSDWDNVEISFDRMVDDLDAVIGSYNHKKVALFGPSQAASISIAYARKYPEKISHLILAGAYARGRCKRDNPDGVAESSALVTLIRQSWGRDNPMARQMMTSLLMPEASLEESTWFNEFQKSCGPAENLARHREMFDDIDITRFLDEVKAPTLVIHSSSDSIAPLAEGKLIASHIPDARLITLDSKNHLVFEGEPGFERFLDAVKRFVC